MKLRRYLPWIWAAGALLAAGLANAAVGAVAIPLDMVARMVVARLPLLEIEPNWPAAFATILY